MTPTPPRARQVPHAVTLHGETWEDPFFWLRERDNPEVLAYLSAENAYTEQVLRPTEALQQQIYTELRGRIRERDESAPVRDHGYLYYTRMEPGKQYPIYCRRRTDLDAVEELLIDQNRLAEGHAFCAIGVFATSPDQRWLAYSVDFSGAEQFTLRIKSLETGETLPDELTGTYYSVAWASDNRTLFYTTLDQLSRPCNVMRHTLGTDQAQDVEVFHEPDEGYFVDLDRTRSGAFIIISAGSTTTSEAWFIPADQPEAAPRVIDPRRQNIEYYVAHHGDRFLIVTNDGALNYKLVAAPIGTPGHEHWQELVAHRDDVLLDGIDAFAGHVALYTRRNGLQRIEIIDPDGGQVRDIEFPEPVYMFRRAENHEWDTPVLRFTYSSLVTPTSAIDYHMPSGQWTVIKQDEIPGYDPAQYRSERLFAVADDGTEIPISLVYRREITRDGGHPLLLYGYGAYGISSDPSFVANRLSLIDRGVIFAIAHIRGGSELGRAWYDAGRMLNKRNSFTDFIACAEHLVTEGYTSPERLAAYGRSAGGLLMGTITNLRPDLFRAILTEVPFLDVINTMNDPSLPLTVPEYEQWGNPNDPEAFGYMRSYSPYDNLRATAYPHMLLTGGLNDPRVQYWEPAKYVARLRTLKTDDNMLLLKTDMGAGHKGVTGRYEALKDVALEYAFLLRALDVE